MLLPQMAHGVANGGEAAAAVPGLEGDGGGDGDVPLSNAVAISICSTHTAFDLDHSLHPPPMRPLFRQLIRMDLADVHQYLYVCCLPCVPHEIIKEGKSTRKLV